jgi:arabinose-5-phosphate isomerase
MLIKYSTIKILLPKVFEAGNSLAPTSSSINFLAWGDSLAIALSKRKKWTNKNFISTHPSGSLATSLILVKDIMAKGKAIPLISSNKNMRYAINIMTKKKLGMVCVKDKKNQIAVCVDGDLRRHANNLYKKNILDVATKNPSWVSDDDTALSAINKMNSSGITSLLVTRKKDINKKIKKLIGVIHLHAALALGIK